MDFMILINDSQKILVVEVEELDGEIKTLRLWIPLCRKLDDMIDLAD